MAEGGCSGSGAHESAIKGTPDIITLTQFHDSLILRRILDEESPRYPRPDEPSSSFNPNEESALYPALIESGLRFPLKAHVVELCDFYGISPLQLTIIGLRTWVFMEGVTFSRRFSLPMRVFVPVFYNAKRLVTISEWLRMSEIIGKEEEEVKNGTMTMRVYVGRGLAVVNMCFWAFNLFGFLLPVYLPRAFKRYYDLQAKF